MLEIYQSKREIYANKLTSIISCIMIIGLTIMGNMLLYKDHRKCRDNAINDQINGTVVLTISNAYRWSKSNMLYY